MSCRGLGTVGGRVSPTNFGEVHRTGTLACNTPAVLARLLFLHVVLFLLLVLNPCRQMVKDICTFKKIFLEEMELEKSAADNWRYK